MNRYSRAYTRLCGFFYTADKGGAAGGDAPTPTLKQQLENAEKAKAEAEKKLKDAEQKATDLQGDLDQATEKVAEIEKERDKAQADLKAATEKVTKLEGEAKGADERAREISAAAGVPPVQKPEETAKPAAASGKELFGQYQKLMSEGDSAEATAFWEKHEKALQAYANSKEAKGN